MLTLLGITRNSGHHIGAILEDDIHRFGFGIQSVYHRHLVGIGTTLHVISEGIELEVGFLVDKQIAILIYYRSRYQAGNRVGAQSLEPSRILGITCVQSITGLSACQLLLSGLSTSGGTERSEIIAVLQCQVVRVTCPCVATVSLDTDGCNLQAVLYGHRIITPSYDTATRVGCITFHDTIEYAVGNDNTWVISHSEDTTMCTISRYRGSDMHRRGYIFYSG